MSSCAAIRNFSSLISQRNAYEGSIGAGLCTDIMKTNIPGIEPEGGEAAGFSIFGDGGVDCCGGGQ